jgi:hypothetical protein
MATVTATATLTVNGAFLQEIKEASGELWQLLARVRRLCHWPISTRASAKLLVESLRQLLDEIGTYFTLEEAYGYFDDPLHVTPPLSRRAHDLRNQHRRLYRELGDIVEQAEQYLYDRKLSNLTTFTASRFDTFYQQFQDHEASEGELILQVYCHHVGAAR